VARAKDTDKPAQIIEAAFEVFGETGYDATLVKEIADRAGISAGTVYTYFRDKRELFQATAREGWSRFLDQIRTLVESEGPAEARLMQLLQIGFDSLRRHLPLLRGMLFESSQANILQESIDELCVLVERLLDGRTAGALNPDVDPALRRSVIRFTVIGVLFSAALAKPDRVEREMDGLRKTVTGMLAAGTPGKPGDD
jgi:AcrR family transcriptional regulator